MKSKVWQKRAALFLLIVYSLDLVWKLTYWRDEFGGVPWWGIGLGLIVRFAFMGFILYLYLKLRKAPQTPPTVTKEMRAASLRSIRIIHIILLAAIASYAFLAERLARPTAQAPALFMESFSILAALMVMIAYGIRRKVLQSATESLRRDASDATALGRWRMVNILSLVLVMSVALYGFVLRIMGGNRLAAWPFFIGSVVLMLLWRPRLDDGAIGDIQT